MNEARNLLSMEEATETRGKILALEAVMHQMKDDQIECKVTDHFAPGVYAREVLIPKGATVVGKIHKTRHLNIVSAGELDVWTEQGIRRIKAPYTFVSEPGTKRVGYAYEDTVWTTIHPTDETDVGKIEEMIIAKTYAELPEEVRLKLGITAPQVEG